MVKRTILLTIAILVILPFTPWWMIALLAGISGLFACCPKDAAAVGAMGVSLSWAIMMGYQYFSSGQILMSRVAEMFGVYYAPILGLITLAIGGILGGLSALTGKLLKDILKP